MCANSQARNIYRCRYTSFHDLVTMSYLANHSKQSIYNHVIGGILEGCRRFESILACGHLPVRPPRSQPFHQSTFWYAYTTREDLHLKFQR